MGLTSEQLKRLRRTPVHAGNRLKAARAIAGLTQVQLATEIGITQGALSDMERRRYDGLKVDTARKFADYFGCAIEDLFPSRREAA